MDRSQWDDPRLFLVVPSDRTRVNKSAHIGTKQVPSEHEEKLLHCKGDRTLEQAVQRDWIFISFLDTFCAIYSREPMLVGGLFQPPQFCNSVIIMYIVYILYMMFLWLV